MNIHWLGKYWVNYGILYKTIKMLNMIAQKPLKGI